LAGCLGFTERFTATYMGAADELFSLVQRHSIGCAAEQNGWIRSVHGPAAVPDFEKMLRGWQDAGVDIDELDATLAEKMSGSQSYGQGWLAKRGGSVHPMSYVRGLAAAALQAGAAICSNTRIETLTQEKGKWTLIAPIGSITARIYVC